LSSRVRGATRYFETESHLPIASKDAATANVKRKTYEARTKTRAMNLKFTVDEIVQVSPEWAFVRSKSSGSSKVNSTGAANAEANQELLVLHKSDDGAWKIARYSFSNTNPPPHS
jgi:ketosteroid isomerase-like protein